MAYNGWKNYETWNVALWICNDEGLYNLVKDCGNYRFFVEVIRGSGYGEPIAYETPDGVSWKDSALDIEALDDLVAEL